MQLNKILVLLFRTSHYVISSPLLIFKITPESDVTLVALVDVFLGNFNGSIFIVNIIVYLEMESL